MRIFFLLSSFLFLSGLGWLTVARPYVTPALTAVGDQAVYVQGRIVRVLGESGAVLAEWKATRSVQQALHAGEQVGLVFDGSDDLHLFTREGGSTGRVAAPQKAGGRGRWADAGDRWLFLHPERSALFVTAKGDPAWKLMLPPEEELVRPVDVAAYPRGAAILCEDPPQVVWYTFEGEPDGDLQISMRLVPSVRYFILEDAWDYLKTQQARIPWKLELDAGGAKALILFRTKDDKYRRLAFLWKEREGWRSRGIILPSVAGRFRTSRSPQDVAFRGTGILLAGRQGGLWLYPSDRLAPLKAWVEPPPPGRWERIRHQRRWGWIALFLSMLLFWAATATRGSKVVIPKESFLWSGMSALLPGLGSLLSRDYKWGAIWLFSAVLWAGVSLTLMILMGRGVPVTTVTLFESLAMFGLTWLFSVIHAFRAGMLRSTPKTPRPQV